MPLLRKDLASLEPGVNQDVEAYNQRQNMKLQQLLKGQAQEQELNRAQQFFNANKGGAGATVKVGDTSIASHEFNPMQMQAKSADAVRHAVDHYNKGAPEIQKRLSAITEGLDSVNDPNNIGSLGQARTLLLKAMGMNRYNSEEAKAVLPEPLRGRITELFNAVGGDATPLNEPQRATVNQFFRTNLDAIAKQHDILKQQALDTYRVSPFFNEGTHAQIASTIGGPLDKAIQAVQQKYQGAPATPGPNTTKQANPGILDALTKFLQGGGTRQPDNNPVPQSGMSFEQWKAAGKPKAGQ